MGLFKKREKREKELEKNTKTPTGEKSGFLPETETTAIILLGKDVGWSAVSRVVEDRFGSQALAFADNSNPQAPVMHFQSEGVEFFCSYIPMPYPAPGQDLAAIEEGLFSPEEKAEMLENQAFLVLSQKDGGTALEAKRHICCLFTRLTAALLSVEGACGVYVNSAELLISRRVYLYHADILEQNLQDPEYFPAPLWVSIRQGQKGDIFLIGTWGLRQFGLLELWFMDPDAEWAEIHQRLYLLSAFEITGKDFYKDMDTIQFTPGRTSMFRELKGALFIKEV